MAGDGGLGLDAATPPAAAGGRGRAVRVGLGAVLCLALAAGVWRGCVSDFRRALPLAATRVQTASLRVSSETAFYGRADISETEFRKVARRLGLAPFRTDMPYAARYFMSNGQNPADLAEMLPPPPWFTPPADLRACWCVYRFCDYRAACYHNGTMFYLTTSSWFEGA